VAKISLGLDKELRVGNLEARRDWGYSADYVKAMWLMLQQDSPEDYVIATGKTYSVKDLVKFAFGYVGLNWEDFVVVDEKLYRPAEVHELRGDFKAKRKLGWEPTMSFEDLVKTMLEEDLKRLKDQEFSMKISLPIQSGSVR
jgi:GDPmannose 4,6-dehydratase